MIKGEISSLPSGPLPGRTLLQNLSSTGKILEPSHLLLYQGTQGQLKRTTVKIEKILGVCFAPPMSDSLYSRTKKPFVSFNQTVLTPF